MSYRESADLYCPACRERMEQGVRIGGAVFSVCRACGGLWLDGEGQEELKSGRETGACPRCRVPLAVLVMGPASHCCNRCGAVFVPGAAVEAARSNTEDAFPFDDHVEALATSALWVRRHLRPLR